MDGDGGEKLHSRVKLIRFVKVSTDGELGLIDDSLDLDGSSSSDVLSGQLGERLVVLFNRGTVEVSKERKNGSRGKHLSEMSEKR